MAFPFSSGTQSKVRPALVVLDTGDADVVVARITTQPHKTATDATLHKWKASGLLAPSIARLHKLWTVEKTMILRTLGSLQKADRDRVAKTLQQTFGNW